MRCTIWALKIILLLFMIGLWVVGIIMMLIGSYLYTDVDAFVIFGSKAMIKNVPLMFMIHGGCLVLYSLIAFTLVPHKHYVVSFILAISLVIVFFAQVITTVAGLWYKTKLDDNLFKGLNISMMNFASGKPSDPLWNNLQATHKCCGIISFRDWFSVPWTRDRRMVPPSCCKDLQKCHNEPPLIEQDIYTRGCYRLFHDTLHYNQGLTIIITVIVLLFQVLAIVFAVFLTFKQKSARAKAKQSAKAVLRSASSRSPSIAKSSMKTPSTPDEGSPTPTESPSERDSLATDQSREPSKRGSASTVPPDMSSTPSTSKETKTRTTSI